MNAMKPKKRYEKSALKALIARVRELKLSGNRNEQVAVQLNSGGYTTASGLPWSAAKVSALMHHYRRSFSGVRRKGKAKISRAVLIKAASIRGSEHALSRATIESIVTDPALSDTARVRMITAYLQA
jgi:hypothetical protein